MMGKPTATGSVLALGIAVLVAGAAAAASQGGAEGETKSAENDASRRICRTITPTPSRISRRVCRTQIEWEAMSREAQDSALKHSFDQTRQGFVPGANNPDPR